MTPSIAHTRSRRLQLLALSIAIALPLALAGCDALTGSAPHAPPAGWHASLTKAQELAIQSNRPVLMDFTADWCPPCQAMKKNVLPRQDVAQLLQSRFVPVIIDGTSPNSPNQEIFERHGVQAIPTFIILSPAGKELARATGGMSASEFLAFLQPHATPGS